MFALPLHCEVIFSISRSEDMLQCNTVSREFVLYSDFQDVFLNENALNQVCGFTYEMC